MQKKLSMILFLILTINSSFSQTSFEQACVFVVVGPSGVGKTTVTEYVVSQGLAKFVPTCTTREPRAGEKNGEHYHFLTREYFEQNLSQFIKPIQQINGDWYGPKLEHFQAVLNTGHHVITVVTADLAKHLKEQIFPGRVVNIFVKPTLSELFALPILRHRLIGRNEKEENIQKRLKNAPEELAVLQAAEYQGVFDHVVVNEELLATYRQMVAIVTAYSLAKGCQDAVPE
jgi:guanylate kinase